MNQDFVNPFHFGGDSKLKESCCLVCENNKEEDE